MPTETKFQLHQPSQRRPQPGCRSGESPLPPDPRLGVLETDPRATPRGGDSAWRSFRPNDATRGK